PSVLGVSAAAAETNTSAVSATRREEKAIFTAGVSSRRGTRKQNASVRDIVDHAPGKRKFSPRGAKYRRPRATGVTIGGRGFSAMTKIDVEGIPPELLQLVPQYLAREEGVLPLARDAVVLMLAYAHERHSNTHGLERRLRRALRMPLL